MSKTCSICSAEINLMSEYNLKKGSKPKICFECYQHIATALKGEMKSIDVLRSRYRDDVSDNVVEYIDSIEKKIKNDDVSPATEAKDTFYDLVGNNIKKENPAGKSKIPQAVIYIDKLNQAKVSRLQRAKIIAQIMFAALLLIVPILAFYIYIVVNSTLAGSLVLFFGIISILVIGILRTVLDTLLSEST